jgi:flagellar biosynthesis protein FlhG
LIATPEPTSITDAYATMKVLARTPGEQDFQLVINQVDSENQGKEVYQTLYRAAEHFLNLSPGYMGFVSKDRNLPRAVSLQKPIMELQPDSKACRNIRSLATRLVAHGVSVRTKGATRRAADSEPLQYGIR